MQSVDELVRDLEALANTYRHLQGLARRQSEILQGGQWQGLEVLVEEKQAAMARVEDLLGRTQLIQVKWDDVLAGFAPNDRSRVETAMAAARQELGALIALEEEGRKAMDDRRGRALDEMKRLSSGRRARGAYGDEAKQTPPKKDPP